MIYTGRNAAQYDLPSTLLNSGGEGDIYNINGMPDRVAKIYRPEKLNPKREEKIKIMLDNPPPVNILDNIAWPLDALYLNNNFAGFVMKKISFNENLNVIYEFSDNAKYSNMPWEYKIIISENLCAVLKAIHDIGHVFGDLNPKNIFVNPNTGLISFLDTDTYHIQNGVYPCTVGLPDYLPVEIQKKMMGSNNLENAALPTFSKDTDNFALAIHIFQLLMNGVHPFSCAQVPEHPSVVWPQPIESIVNGYFPFIEKKPKLTIPSQAPKLEILPKAIQTLFQRAFVDGHKNPAARPKPEEWYIELKKLRADLKKCNKVAHHEYSKVISYCPWCRAIETNKKVMDSFTANSLSQTRIRTPARPGVLAPGSRTGSLKERKAGYPILAGICAAIIYILFFSPFNFFPNMQMEWVMDRQSSMAGTVQIVTVISSGLNFRSEPSSSSEIIKAVSRGDVLIVRGAISNGWMPVEHNGSVGWVDASYISEINRGAPDSSHVYAEVFPLPVYASAVLVSGTQSPIFRIFILIGHNIIPFILLLAAAIITAIICKKFNLRHSRNFIFLYGLGILLIILFPMINPNNLADNSSIYPEISEFSTAFSMASIFIPFSLGLMFFMVIYILSGMNRRHIARYLVILSLSYFLISFLSISAQYNYSIFIDSFENAGFGNHYFSPQRLIFSSLLASALAVIPSVLFVKLEKEKGILAKISISSYGAGSKGIKSDILPIIGLVIQSGLLVIFFYVLFGTDLIYGITNFSMIFIIPGILSILLGIVSLIFRRNSNPAFPWGILIFMLGASTVSVMIGIWDGGGIVGSIIVLLVYLGILFIAYSISESIIGSIVIWAIAGLVLSCGINFTPVFGTAPVLLLLTLPAIPGFIIMYKAEDPYN